MNADSLENANAICYLHRVNDEANKCILTNSHLWVIRNGKGTSFELDNIQLIYFTTRKMLLPLVAGGIVASLSAVSIFSNYYSGWFVILLLFFALFIFYLGWVGYTALTVQDAVHHQDFQLNYISKNLEQFVNFANKMIKNRDKSKVLSLFHVTLRSDWENALQKGIYAPLSLEKEKFIHASEAHQLQAVASTGIFDKNQDWLVLTIDPFKVKPEIRYEPGVHKNAVKPNLPDNELFPHIYGPLNIDAVIKSESLFQE